MLSTNVNLLPHGHFFDYTWLGSIMPQPIDLKQKLFMYNNSYIVLEDHNEVTDIIEKTKYIFGIPTRRYNTCRYKNKKYFMFECFPFNERDYSFVKKKTFPVDVQIVGLFHWIMGIKGKFSEYDNGYYNKVTSKGPYKVDFKKTDLTYVDVSRLIPDVKVKSVMGTHFNDEFRKDLLFDLINDKYRNWYLQIMTRINEL